MIIIKIVYIEKKREMKSMNVLVLVFFLMVDKELI